MNRIISLILAAVVLCSAAAVAVSAEIDLPLIPIDDMTEPESVWDRTVNADKITVTGYTGTRAVIKIPTKLDNIGVSAIGAAAFAGNESITGATIPSAIRTIGDGAFENCTSLNQVSLSSNMTALGEAVFKGCVSLTSVSLKKKLTSIGDEAFYGCSALESISLPTVLNAIGERSFYGCSSLSSVTIPASVTSIGSQAFDGCSSLVKVYFDGTRAAWNAIAIEETNDTLLNARIICIDEPLPGDLEFDRSINARDILLLMRYLVGYDMGDVGTEVADYNCDGKVNNRDVLQMMLDIVNGVV